MIDKQLTLSVVNKNYNELFEKILRYQKFKNTIKEVDLFFSKVMVLKIMIQDYEKNQIIDFNTLKSFNNLILKYGVDFNDIVKKYNLETIMENEIVQNNSELAD